MGEPTAAGQQPESEPAVTDAATGAAQAEEAQEPEQEPAAPGTGETPKKPDIIFQGKPPA
jgi:hypothetical protein